MQECVHTHQAVFGLKTLPQNALNILASQHAHAIARSRPGLNARFECLDQFGLEMGWLAGFGTISQTRQTFPVIAMNPNPDLTITERKGFAGLRHAVSSQHMPHNQNTLSNFGMSFCRSRLLEFRAGQLPTDL